VAVTLGVATVAGATAARRPAVVAAPALKNVRILGYLSLFSDPRVQQDLRASGWNVTSDNYGAPELVTHLPQAVSGYQIAYLPNQIEGRLVQDRLSSLGASNNSIAPYGSRLVVATYPPIAQLLRKHHLATMTPDGKTWLFNLQAYVTAVNQGLSWAGITGGQASQSSGPVLLNTTDPHTSALAQQFVALASYAVNGDRLVTDQATARRINRQLRPIFTEQGGMLTGATETFGAVSFNGGKYAAPLTLAYENQYLKPELAGGSRQRVLMYLDPEAIAENTLVALGNAGSAVSQLLDSGPITEIAENEYGFITAAGVSAFAAAMGRHGLTVPGPELTTDSQYPLQSITYTLLAGLP
jgi:hypothetical protein